MTKPITSAAVLMLYEEGKLALDDPVEKFLPELADRTVYERSGNRPAKSVMTVRHLLLHTSGLIYGRPDGSPIEQQYDEARLLDKDGTLQDMIDKLAGLPLAFDPGTRWEYGVSADVLGAVVERASGQTLEAFFRERIFAPLKMHDTGFEVPPDKLARFAACYERRGGKWVVEDAPATSRYARQATMYSGGGGLVSTAPDYWRFLMMLAGGGTLDGKRLLKAKTVELMTHDQLRPGRDRPSGAEQGFGFGCRVFAEPLAPEDRHLAGEYGWFGRASTSFWTQPREELTVVALEQTLPYDDRTWVAVHEIAYAAIGGGDGEDAGR